LFSLIFNGEIEKISKFSREIEDVQTVWMQIGARHCCEKQSAQVCICWISPQLSRQSEHSK